MEVKLHPSIIIGGATLIVVLLFFLFRPSQPEENIDLALLEKYSELETNYTKLKNKNISLKDYIGTVEATNTELLSEISKYKLKKQEIKYIDRIVYKTKEVVVEKPVDTTYYVYRSDSGLPLCSFENKDTLFSFSVLPVEYRVDIVKTDKETSIKLKGKSLYDDKEYLIPIDVKETKTTTTTSKRLIEPKLSVGMSLDISSSLEMKPIVSFPFVHISKDLDVAVPKLQLSDSPTIGLDIVSYNIGSKLPLVSDVWVGIGPSIGLNEKNINLTLVSRF